MQAPLAMLLRLCLLRITSVKSLGNPENEPRILNGIVVEEGKFKSVVGVKTGEGSWCTGSILNQYTILTAAHCLHSKSFDVYVGCLNVLSCSNKRSGVGLVHPKYKNPEWKTVWGRLVHDVGIIKTEVPLNAEVMPIARPPLPEPPYRNCTVVGYGISCLGQILHGVLYQLPLKEIVRCTTIWPEDNTIASNFLCAAYVNGPRFGSGDSGGPLICKGQQVGVTSNRRLADDKEAMVWAFIPQTDVQWVPYSVSGSPTCLLTSLLVILTQLWV